MAGELDYSRFFSAPAAPAPTRSSNISYSNFFAGQAAALAEQQRRQEEERQKAEARRLREERMAALAAAGAMPTEQAATLGPDPGAVMPAVRQAANQAAGYVYGIPERLGLAPEGTYQEMQRGLEEERINAMAHGHTGAQVVGALGGVGASILPALGAAKLVQGGAVAGEAAPTIARKLAATAAAGGEGAVQSFLGATGTPAEEQLKMSVLGGLLGSAAAAGRLIPKGRLNPEIPLPTPGRAVPPRETAPAAFSPSEAPPLAPVVNPEMAALADTSLKLGEAAPAESATKSLPAATKFVTKPQDDGSLVISAHVGDHEVGWTKVQPKPDGGFHVEWVEKTDPEYKRVGQALYEEAAKQTKGGYRGAMAQTEAGSAMAAKMRAEKPDLFPPEPAKQLDLPLEEAAAPPEEKMFAALRSAVARRGKQEAIYSAGRRERIGAASAVGKEIPGEQGFYAQLGKLKGEHEKVAFHPLRDAMTQEETDAVFDNLRSNPALRGFESVRAQTGLLKMLNGEVPQRGEIALLKKAYGEKVADIEKAVPLLQRSKDMAAEIIGLPRAFQASLDLSFPFRQGLVAGTRYPKEFASAFGAMHKYAASENAFRSMVEEVQSRPNYDLMKESGLALSAEAMEPTAREEQFISSLAEKTPVIGRVVRASNRAYTGMANKLRADVFDRLVSLAEESGRDPHNDPALTKDIARFVNTATGRGDLGKLAPAGEALSTAFFAPRLVAARVNMLNPLYYAKLDPLVRKQALQSAMTTAAFIGTAGALAKAGGASVNLDPRNADFGKIRIGNTRVDPGAGFLQFVRLGAQLISGQVVSSTTGSVTKLGQGYGKPTRLDVLARFAQTKASPVSSFIMDNLRGKDMLGQPITMKKSLANHITPLVLQDFTDLMKDNPKLAALLIPSAYGAGLQTYSGWDEWRNEPVMGGPAEAAMKTHGLNVGSVGDTILKHQLDEDQKKDYQALYEAAAKKRLESIAAGEGFKAAKPERQKKMLEHAIDLARKQAAIQFRRKYAEIFRRPAA